MREFTHKRTGFTTNANMPLSAAKKVANHLYKNMSIKTKQFHITDTKTNKIYHFFAIKEKEKLIVKAKHKKIIGGKYEDWSIHYINPSQLLHNQLVVIYDKTAKKYISINQLSEDYYNLSKQNVGKSLYLTEKINSESVFRVHKFTDSKNTYLYFELDNLHDIKYYLAHRSKYNHNASIYDKNDKEINNISYLDNNPFNNNNLYFLLENNRIKYLNDNYIVKSILPKPSFIIKREIGESPHRLKRQRHV
jgi:hypothetical protein